MFEDGRLLSPALEFIIIFLLECFRDKRKLPWDWVGHLWVFLRQQLWIHGHRHIDTRVLNFILAGWSSIPTSKEQLSGGSFVPWEGFYWNPVTGALPNKRQDRLHSFVIPPISSYPWWVVYTLLLRSPFVPRIPAESLRWLESAWEIACISRFHHIYGILKTGKKSNHEEKVKRCK